MSDGEIFIVGLLVTLIVGAALALLIYGAILDGRAQQAHEDAHPEDQPATRRR